MDVVVTQQVVQAYKELMVNPEKHKLPFSPIEQIFIKAKRATAKHEFWGMWQYHTGRDIPKLIFYIVMNEVFGQCDGKDEKGNLGYHLEFNESLLQ